MNSQEIVLKELGPEWDESWDRLAGAAPESGFMQSSAWAEFKRTEGYETHRFGLFDGECKPFGGATVLSYPQGGEGFLICPEGPVLPWQDTELARACLRLIACESEQIAESQGGIGLRIE